MRAAFHDFKQSFKSPRERIAATLAFLSLPCLVIAPVVSLVGYYTGHGNSWGRAALVVTVGIPLLVIAIAVAGSGRQTDRGNSSTNRD
jgi:peptidoglycan/LPS O-acetylase OafA/YrhL